ncbi:hypothetical protein EZV62_003914 [Acer yangbiense]|uniref:DUF668 domain-containing protein n=1 Tax=Acer yangbiense TaxID=1000413 RepID=A0A5C7IIS9_9ROSI|nr:hypothetical protein EZV62_003914 [Acer yangbiense]
MSNATAGPTTGYTIGPVNGKPFHLQKIASAEPEKIPQRLGVAGLALHYANIINQIDNIAANQDYEIEKLNERDCEPFRWCFCNSGLSSQGLSTHGRFVSLADTPQSKG